MCESFTNKNGHTYELKSEHKSAVVSSQMWVHVRSPQSTRLVPVAGPKPPPTGTARHRIVPEKATGCHLSCHSTSAMPANPAHESGTLNRDAGKADPRACAIREK